MPEPLPLALVQIGKIRETSCVSNDQLAEYQAKAQQMYQHNGHHTQSSYHHAQSVHRLRSSPAAQDLALPQIMAHSKYQKSRPDLLNRQTGMACGQLRQSAINH